MRIRRPVLSAVAGATLLLTLVASFASTPAGAAVTPPAQGWTTVTAPLPNDANANPVTYIASSTCPVANGCVTVGSYKDTSNYYWGVIEAQSGTTWTETQAPEPTGYGTGSHQFAELGGGSCGIGNPCTAVACPSPTMCVAVGLYETQTGYDYGLINTGSGTTWTAQAAPEPASDRGTEGDGEQNGSLQSVSCSSTTSCVAVGQYTNTDGHNEVLIDVLSGTTWTAVTPPTLPSNAAPSSSAFSTLHYSVCLTTPFCVATGTYDDSSHNAHGLIEMLSGTTWTATEAPAPSDVGVGAFPLGVSCASTHACVVAGYYDNTSSHTEGLLDTFNGTAWSTAGAAPEPTGAGTGSDLFASLDAVSCAVATTTFCVAVGGYTDTAAADWGLILTWDGTTWTANKAPEPSNTEPPSSQGASLLGVDCTSVSFCMTDGSYQANVSTGIQLGMVDTYAAGAWTSVQTPMPSTLKQTTGGGGFSKYLACASPVACVVSGGFTDTSGHNQSYLDTYTGVQGYWLGASDGGIFAFGNNQFYGSTGGIHLNKPIVGMAATPDNLGYWFVGSDGGVFTEGDALYFGSTGGTVLNKPIVGMATTPDGKGYWLVASDGGIFAFGDAVYWGSTGAIHLNKPIVGMAATPSGKGYWLVASDGGIFTFGDATYLGSTGAVHLNKPIVGIGATPNGDGYWLVASDGGIFTFGNTQFYGSTGAIALNKPIVAMAVTPSGLGYWLVASDGGIFTFGDAVFYGSTGGTTLNKPIIGMAT